jgi:Retrotransposon gag protein
MSNRRPPAPSAPDTDLESRLESMQNTIDSFQRLFDRMNTTSQPPTAPLEAKVNSPEPFDGSSATKLRDFLTQVRLVIDLQPSRFQSDTIKVKYASSFLRGSAFSWIQSYLDNDDPPAWMGDFSLFAAEITRVFGDPDIIGSATRSLRKLRQTGSVASYASEFRRHSSLLSWGEQALISQFYDGLKEPIKDELARTERPTELKTSIESAIRIDNRLYERRMERGETPRPSIPPPRGHSHGYATPATADNRRANPAKRAVFRPPFQRLDEEQKEFRRRNNLCMYCGSADHALPSCPICPRTTSGPRNDTRTADATTRPSGNDLAQRQ